MLFEGEANHCIPTLTLHLMKELSLTMAEDLYSTHPKLFSATLNEAELTIVSMRMKDTGTGLMPVVIWVTAEATKPGRTEILLLQHMI